MKSLFYVLLFLGVLSTSYGQSIPLNVPLDNNKKFELMEDTFDSFYIVGRSSYMSSYSFGVLNNRVYLYKDADLVGRPAGYDLHQLTEILEQMEINGLSGLPDNLSRGKLFAVSFVSFVLFSVLASQNINEVGSIWFLSIPGGMASGAAMLFSIFQRSKEKIKKEMLAILYSLNVKNKSSILIDLNIETFEHSRIVKYLINKSEELRQQEKSCRLSSQ